MTAITLALMDSSSFRGDRQDFKLRLPQLLSLYSFAADVLLSSSEKLEDRKKIRKLKPFLSITLYKKVANNSTEEIFKCFEPQMDFKLL